MILIPKHHAWRSDGYRRWIMSLPCAITGAPGCDPHHIKRPGFGGTTKASDVFCIPLSRTEHNQFHAMGWASWEESRNVDQRDIALRTIERAIIDGVLTLS